MDSSPDCGIATNRHDNARLRALIRDVLAPHDRLHGAPGGAETVLSTAFQSIRRRTAPDVGTLAVAAGISLAHTRRAIDVLATAGRVERTGGRVVAAAGLSLTPTPHALTLPAGRLYGWCALDAIGIPAALRTTATVLSACAYCRQPIRCSIKDGQPRGGWVATVPARVCSNPRDEFCPRSLFFCTDAHAGRWLANDRSGPVLVLGATELAELGRAVWAWTTTPR